MMRPPRALLVVRIAALVALLVSGALLVDYQTATPQFCEAGSTCDVIKSSGYGHPFGIPVPLLGILSFLSLLVLSVLPSERARRLTGWAAMLGGVIAFGLLATQAALFGSFCKLCVLVDTSAIVAALAGSNLRNYAAPTSATETERDWFHPAAWVILSLCAAAAAIVFSISRPPGEAPAEIRSFWKTGAINVVDFSDFECPFCRLAHPRIADAIKDVPNVNFVRLTVPLDMHPHARFASRAYLCSEQQGKGEEVAHALFLTENMTARDCEKIAVDHGVALDAYRACIESPETDKKIDETRELFKKAKMRGLPSVWIGNELLGGLREPGEYKDAVANATSASSSAAKLAPLVILIALVIASVVLGRRSLESAATRA
ncbi:MAG: vitamin K epoxide reductase family protein [Polyangiaceae bacterium]